MSQCDSDSHDVRPIAVLSDSDAEYIENVRALLGRFKIGQLSRQPASAAVHWSFIITAVCTYQNYLMWLLKAGCSNLGDVNRASVVGKSVTTSMYMGRVNRELLESL